MATRIEEWAKANINSKMVLYIRRMQQSYPENTWFEAGQDINEMFVLTDANLILMKKVVLYDYNGIAAIKYLFKYNNELDYIEEMDKVINEVL